MWHTQEGDRKLEGKERALFVHAAVELHDLLAQPGGGAWASDAPSFNTIPIENRPYALLSVVDQLLNDEPDPELYAWNEGAVLAVFNLISQRLEEEVMSKGAARTTIWRTLVHEAFMETCYVPGEVEWDKGEGPDQPITSENLDEWDFKILLLTDDVLFDRDCEDDQVMDLAPRVAETVKAELAISDDYYTAIPPDFSESERARLGNLLEHLRKERTVH